MTQTLERESDPVPRSRVVIWLQAARPRTLGASLVPVGVGSAVAAAEGSFRPLVTVVCLLTALLLQIAANLGNDAFDFLRGIDTPQRRGPTRVTQAGLISAQSVLRGAGLVTFLAACCGIYLVYVGGMPILIVGTLAILCAFAYSGGPFPLASHGLGELAVFVFFGVVAVAGSAYLNAGAVSEVALLAALPVGSLITAILVVNNLRDIETDREVGKRTLAVRLGARGTQIEYVLLLALAYVWPLFVLALGRGSWGLFLPWLSLPWAVGPLRSVLTTRDADALNRSLVSTVQLQAAYGVLLVVGIVS